VRQIESVEHYAARRDLPTTEDQFGRLMFDLKEPRGPTPWRKMLEPLTEYEVVNPKMAMHKDFSIMAEKQNKIQMQALEGNYPGQEYKSKNLNWKAAEAEKGASKDWFEVWYSGRVSPIIFGLRTVEEQIYIRGHGQPGDSGIYSGGFNWRLGAEEVAKRLIASGLQTSFAGKIKCYNCHSAEQGINEPFAQALADYCIPKDTRAANSSATMAHWILTQVLMTPGLSLTTQVTPVRPVRVKVTLPKNSKPVFPMRDYAAPVPDAG
jgi:hypothetical protein